MPKFATRTEACLAVHARHGSKFAEVAKVCCCHCLSHPCPDPKHRGKMRRPGPRPTDDPHEKTAEAAAAKQLRQARRRSRRQDRRRDAWRVFGAVLDGEDDETAACSTASDASGDEDGHQARRSLPARACKTRAETRARAEAEADAEAESGDGARQVTPDPGRAVARRGHATASMEAAGGRATAVESSGQAGRRPAARDSKSSDLDEPDGTWDFLFETPHAAESSDPAGPSGARDSHHDRETAVAPGRGRRGRSEATSKSSRREVRRPEATRPGQREGRTKPGGQTGRRPAARDSKSSDPEKLDGTWDFLFEGPHAAESSDPAVPSGARDSRHDREPAAAPGRGRPGRSKTKSKSSRQTAGRATRHARQGRGAGATEGTAQEPDSPRREPTDAAQFARSPAAAPELDMTKARVKRSRGSRKRRTRGHPDPKAKRRRQGKRWDITKAEDPDYVQP